MDSDVAAKVIQIINGKNDIILSSLKKLKEKCKNNDSHTNREIDTLCDGLKRDFEEMIETCESKAGGIMVPTEIVTLLDNMKETDDYLLNIREEVNKKKQELEQSCDRFKIAANVFSSEIRSQFAPEAEKVE